MKYIIQEMSDMSYIEAGKSNRVIDMHSSKSEQSDKSYNRKS